MGMLMRTCELISDEYMFDQPVGSEASVVVAQTQGGQHSQVPNQMHFFIKIFKVRLSACCKAGPSSNLRAVTPEEALYPAEAMRTTIGYSTSGIKKYCIAASILHRH
jgi:hypothetical protein